MAYNTPETKITKFFRPAQAVVNVVKKIARVPGKIADRIENNMKQEDAARKMRDEEMESENFGSPEAYREISKKKMVKAQK